MSDDQAFYQEASLDNLLSDPICKTLMRYDRLSPGDVLSEMQSARRRIKQQIAPPKTLNKTRERFLTAAL
ncbi:MULTISPECIES: hypothetical protein [unclassified Iodidimonas]|jgi:hypothetical protein|uniref:hypothetical protein n=1 Tax=unclassified Iodidimonas TaxID=2626145 RepID=UPI0024831512|nr:MULTISPECIES: hypothetical protein [unclassified Iodidimonas]